MTDYVELPAANGPTMVECWCALRRGHDCNCSSIQQVQVGHGPYGDMISIKPMHDHGATIRMQPALRVFDIGERVVVANIGGTLGPTTPALPHRNVHGTIVARANDRLYMVRFADGTTAGYYHNELYRVLRPGT